MSVTPVISTKMRAMGMNLKRDTKKARQLPLPGLAIAAVLALVLAASLSGCTNVATYTQPTLVRVIDASKQPVTADDFYAFAGADYDIPDRVLRLR